jgi:translation initiation factor 2 beta subunit (eIF-2beta)/eIF-5
LNNIPVEQTTREQSSRAASTPTFRDSDREAMKELKVSNKQMTRQIEALTEELNTARARHKSDADTLQKETERLSRERDETVQALRKELKDREDVSTPIIPYHTIFMSCLYCVMYQTNHLMIDGVIDMA